ncbi:MAG: 16S rRNA (guanine(966)-N(2))-methyltransferase RsmD [Parachlamydiaceae bacterium]
MRIISGTFRGRNLVSPKGEQTRPTSSKMRGAVFSMIQQEIDNAAFLDLFSGSGAMGIEALSRGASFAAFVDSSREAIHAIEKNIELCSIKNSTLVLMGDYLRMLDKLIRLPRRYDIVFADAPYAKESTSQLLIDWFENHALLQPGGRLLIEDANKIPPLTEKFTLISSRNSGKTFLHDFRGL